MREALAPGPWGRWPRAGSKATLFLPDGIARLAVVESPPSGADPRDYLRFRLASSLPWPASDAIVDLLPAGRRTRGRGQRPCGAEPWRSTSSLRRRPDSRWSGFTWPPSWPSGAGSVAGRWGHGGVRDRRCAVHAILGDVAVCLAAIRDGELAALRSRRRDSSEGEAPRLLAEAARTARLAGDGDGPVQLVLSGAGSIDLREDLASSAVTGLEGPGEWPDAAEVSWLGGAHP